MSVLSKFFILLAVSFAVSGDYYLKRYGDARRGWDLFWCLVLWEVCAGLWVLAYREHLPLGRTTIFGAALACSANVLIGALIFQEKLQVSQWVGFCCVLTGLVLVGR